MKYLGWIVAAGFAGLSAYLAYAFIYQGRVAPGEDERTAIVVSADERRFILAEMRAFLEDVENIIQGVVRGDMAAVAKAAKNSGMATTHNVPGSLRGKLPLEFKRLGFDTHKKFDAIAEEAAAMADKNKILEMLGDTLSNCTACHASYSLKAD